MSRALLVIDTSPQWEALSPIASLVTVIITPVSATLKRVDAFANTTLQARIASTARADSTETLWLVSVQSTKKIVDYLTIVSILKITELFNEYVHQTSAA